jgi:hypothetical protein
MSLGHQQSVQTYTSTLHAQDHPPTRIRTLTATQVVTHPCLVCRRTRPSQGPHHLHVAILTRGVQRGTTISLSTTDTRTDCTMMANTTSHMQYKTTRLAQHKRTRHDTMRCQRPLRYKPKRPRTPEHQHPPQSSRTLAWFTAAPAPTRALTTSTWPLALAAYSGVQPLICQTPDTHGNNVGAHLHLHPILPCINSLWTAAGGTSVPRKPLCTCTLEHTLEHTQDAPQHGLHTSDHAHPIHRYLPRLGSMSRLSRQAPSLAPHDLHDWRCRVQ